MSYSAFQRRKGCEFMFVGRKSELAKLNKSYEKDGIPITVLYGREGIGKTSLAKEFTKDRECVYYLGRELSRKEQNMYFMSALKHVDARAAEGGKVCFVIDEFDLMEKAYKEFFDEFGEYAENSGWEDHVMILLVSSQVQWVENQMVESMGKLAARIDNVIKLKEFTFLEMVNRFPELSTEDCISVYSILGGVPGYLDLWNPRETVRENVIRLILQENGMLRREAARFLKTSLRELPFYNTILSVLAEDEPKLNYLYNRTGFSRAKISVYIKNLIQIGVAEKYFSYEPRRRDSAMKGLYGISDRFLHFWYKFVFPNLSELEYGDPEEFYKSYIRDELMDFVEQSYVKVCKEFLMLMNRYGKLPGKFGALQTFYGKDGRIPIVAAGEDDRLLVGMCKWSVEPMGSADFERLLQLTEQFGQEADCYYLFSREGFVSELAVMASGMDNIELVDLDSL